jgi:formylglycine-generating enzyme required for sulfatase activity
VLLAQWEINLGSADEGWYSTDDEKPQHTLYLSAYYIGKYPVTVVQYRSFVEESQHKTSVESSLKGNDNHPVVNVDWFDAIAFAQWYGMILPSEAQWEKAARTTDARIYAWGNDWIDGRANTYEYWTKGNRGLRARLQRRKNIGTTTPVGYFSPR